MRFKTATQARERNLTSSVLLAHSDIVANPPITQVVVFPWFMVVCHLLSVILLLIWQKHSQFFSLVVPVLISCVQVIIRLHSVDLSSVLKFTFVEQDWSVILCSFQLSIFRNLLKILLFHSFGTTLSSSNFIDNIFSGLSTVPGHSLAHIAPCTLCGLGPFSHLMKLLSVSVDFNFFFLSHVDPCYWDFNVLQ